MPGIERLVLESEGISELNTGIIKWICNYLNIYTEILLSSEIKKDDELKGKEKLLHIIKILDGDTYINAIGGRDLYSNTDFEDEHIRLFFLKMHSLKYYQFSDEFVPDLSIIDVMMFNAPEEIRKLLDQYSLIVDDKI